MTDLEIAPAPSQNGTGPNLHVDLMGNSAPAAPTAVVPAPSKPVNPSSVPTRSHGEQYFALVEALPVTAFFVTPDNIIRFANSESRAGLARVGLDLAGQTLVGQPLSLLYSHPVHGDNLVATDALLPLSDVLHLGARRSRSA